jgi:hypothetical protein
LLVHLSSVPLSILSMLPWYACTRASITDDEY